MGLNLSLPLLRADTKSKTREIESSFEGRMTMNPMFSQLLRLLSNNIAYHTLYGEPCFILYTAPVDVPVRLA